MKPSRPSFPTFRFYATDDAGNEHVTGDGDFPNGVAAIRHYAETGGFEIAEHGRPDSRSATATLRDEGRTFKLRAVLVDADLEAHDDHVSRRREILSTLGDRATSTLDHRRALELALEMANCSYCQPLDPFELRPLLEKTLRELDVLHEIADGALDPVMRRARSLRANVARRRNEQSRRDAIRRADELDELAEKARIFSYARAAILETLSRKPINDTGGSEWA